MIYCTECLTTNLRPNSDFEDGICIACRYNKHDDLNNYELKMKILKHKIKNSLKRNRRKGAYDCAVGVSGGKDSTRQAHWVRDRLGLRPLLICAAYPPKQMSEIGAKNLSNLISMGFDLITVTPAPETARQLTLKSFKEFGNVCKSTELSLFSTVPRISMELGINLIFWGENPALQVGDAAVLGEDEFDGNNLYKLNTLNEGGISWLNLTTKYDYKLNHYFYPDQMQYKRSKLDIIYLGPAWDDWSASQNATYASLQGLSLRPGEEDKTGDLTNASMIDEEFTNINMLLKYYKFGFGRATDQICEQIRLGNITRTEGINLVKKYDGVCSDEIIQKFCYYTDISEQEFWETAYRYVNFNLFDVSHNMRPKPKFRVGHGLIS